MQKSIQHSVFRHFVSEKQWSYDQPASLQVVQSKMSNLPLGLFLCVICAAALVWKYDAWAGQSGVRGEGLGIVSGQHCCGTLWQLDILPKGDIVFALGVT